MFFSHNISTLEKLTSLQTASLGIFDGLGIDLPDPKSTPTPKDEWILIFGGSTSVGKFAVQVLWHDWGFRKE